MHATTGVAHGSRRCFCTSHPQRPTNAIRISMPAAWIKSRKDSLFKQHCKTKFQATLEISVCLRTRESLTLRSLKELPCAAFPGESLTNDQIRLNPPTPEARSGQTSGQAKERMSGQASGWAVEQARGTRKRSTTRDRAPQADGLFLCFAIVWLCGTTQKPQTQLSDDLHRASLSGPPWL